MSELSRLGCNLMDVMSILYSCMEKESKVFAIKEGYELGNNISSKVMAFAFLEFHEEYKKTRKGF